jgi:hypothetical protein
MFVRYYSCLSIFSFLAPSQYLFEENVPATHFLSVKCALFHFPYAVTPLFATLTQTAGVYLNNSRFGTVSRAAAPGVLGTFSMALAGVN